MSISVAISARTHGARNGAGTSSRADLDHGARWRFFLFVQVNRSTVLLERLGRCFENLNEFQSALAVRDWRGARIDAVQEVLALHLERFLLLHIRHVNI